MLQHKTRFFFFRRIPVLLLLSFTSLFLQTTTHSMEITACDCDKTLFARVFDIGNILVTYPECAKMNHYNTCNGNQILVNNQTGSFTSVGEAP